MTRTHASVPVLAGIGVAAGFFGGLFGVGGGIVVVPLLVILVGLGSKEASATSLAAIGFTAVFGVIAYSAIGHVAWRDAALVGLPRWPARSLGIQLQRRVSSRELTLLFAGLLIVVAVRLFFAMTEVVLALVLGLGAGVLSGMFGVGGGILFVPTLTLVIGLTQIEAEATSLAAMVPVVAVGAWRQNRHGLVRWRVATIVGLASGLGVIGGVILAEALPEHALRKLFALLLVVTAVQLVVSARRT